MYNSGKTVSSLITEVKSSADISITISDNDLLECYNRTEQLLYSEIIKEQKDVTLTTAIASGVVTITLSTIPVLSDENLIEYDDIVSVYVGDRELTPTNLNSISVMRYSFCRDGNDLAIHSNGGTVKIIYNARPKRNGTFYTNRQTMIDNKIPSTIEANDCVQWTHIEESATNLYFGYPMSVTVNEDFLDSAIDIIANAISIVDAESFSERLTEVNYIVNPTNLSSKPYDTKNVYHIERAGDTCTISFLCGVCYSEADDFNDFKDYLDTLNPNITLEFKYLTTENSAQNVRLPYEFVDMMRCRLRAEMYNRANDESQAGKWLEQYNNYLENFKAFIGARTSTYGR